MAESGDQIGWISISELARRRGVDKAAISRRVAKLEATGALSSREVKGRKYVNLADFEKIAGETVDAIREANGRGGARATDPSDPVLAREQARRAALDADMKQLDLDERIGRLMPVERVREATAACAEALAGAIDALPGRAESMAAAVAESGVAGMRAALKALARELRADLSRIMAADADLAEAAQTGAPVVEAIAEVA